jgi:type II secretory pathway pseudopilin PulG
LYGDVPTTTADKGVVHTGQFGKGEAGFSLIESVVLIIMIAILAAVGFPMFFKQQNEANNSWVQQSLDTLQIGIQNYAVDHSGSYPASVSSATLVDPSGKAYVADWPKNAWTLAPMTDSGGTYSEGDYHYFQPTRTAYRIIGYLSTSRTNYTLPWALNRAGLPRGSTP